MEKNYKDIIEFIDKNNFVSAIKILKKIINSENLESLELINIGIKFLKKIIMKQP